MKYFIENNPFIILIGVCLACITTTASVLFYFHQQELLTSSAKFESEIGELKSQISSIDRGIPIESERKFNVARSIVDENQMLLLSPEFKKILPEKISIKTPDTANWEFEKLNAITQLAVGLDDGCREMHLERIKEKGLPENIKPIFTWHQRNSNSAYLNIPPQSQLSSCQHLRIFPVIYVYEIDKEWVQNNVRFFSFYIPPEKLTKEKVTQLIEDPASVASDPESANIYMNQNSAFFSEFTGPFLFNKMYESLNIATLYPEAALRMISIEKALNTLYFLNRYRIPASLNKDDLNDKSIIVVDDEYFVMSIGESAIVINITLPVIGGHHDNFVWTQGWLSGLRIQASKL